MSDIWLFMGAGTAPFTTNGLTLWFDANERCYVDAGVTLCTNGQLVYRWTGRDGSGRYVERTDSAERPTYVTAARNGNAAVRFIADGDRLYGGALGGNFYSSDILSN